jgi:hypothetical protein
MVRRITYQCGSGLLALRTHELMQWRSDLLTSGSELQGKHVSVQIDGGRTKIRGKLRDAPANPKITEDAEQPAKDVPGRSKAHARRTFDSEWREPGPSGFTVDSSRSSPGPEWPKTEVGHPVTGNTAAPPWVATGSARRQTLLKPSLMERH